MRKMIITTLLLILLFSAGGKPLQNGNRATGNRGNEHGTRREVPMVVIDTVVYSMPSQFSNYMGILPAGTFVYNHGGLIQNGGTLEPGGFRSKPETWLILSTGGYALVTDWTNVVYISGVLP